MVKTTVYLDERVAAALRRLVARTGRSQAEIIREAIANATRAAGPRSFRSLGAGEGTGEPVGEADHLVSCQLSCFGVLLRPKSGTAAQFRSPPRFPSA